MAGLVRLLVVLAFASGCSTVSKVEKDDKVNSPQIEDLAQIQQYPGEWEMEKCLHDGKQAERVEIEILDGKLVLRRWQKKVDKAPLFTAVIEPGQQAEVFYKSKDLINENPVINKTQWTWMDKRIVGSMLWSPDAGDKRGNWSAVATGQFYIKKGEPHQMRWVRWGSSHSDRHGQQTWQSECVYKRMSKLAIDNKNKGYEIDLDKWNQAAAGYLEKEETPWKEKVAQDATSAAFNTRQRDFDIQRGAQGRSASQLHDNFQRSNPPRPRRSVEMKIFKTK